METFGADKVSVFKYCRDMLEQELTSDNAKLYLKLLFIIMNKVISFVTYLEEICEVKRLHIYWRYV